MAAVTFSVVSGGLNLETALPAGRHLLQPNSHQGGLWPEAELNSLTKDLSEACWALCCRLPGKVASHTHLVCHQNGCDMLACIASNGQDDEAQEGF